MSWNGQAHFKNLAGFASVSDHFTTLRSKGLNHVSSTGFHEYDLIAYIGQAIWDMYPHRAGDQSFLVFLGSNTSKF